jgi:hypothetical protein
MATFTSETTLLIQGVKGKIDAQGAIVDTQTRQSLQRFTKALFALISTGSQ